MDNDQYPDSYGRTDDEIAGLQIQAARKRRKSKCLAELETKDDEIEK